MEVGYGPDRCRVCRAFAINRHTIPLHAGLPRGSSQSADGLVLAKPLDANGSAPPVCHTRMLFLFLVHIKTILKNIEKDVNFRFNPFILCMVCLSCNESLYIFDIIQRQVENNMISPEPKACCSTKVLSEYIYGHPGLAQLGPFV